MEQNIMFLKLSYQKKMRGLKAAMKSKLQDCEVQ